MEIFSLESLFAPSELENKKTDVALAVANAVGEEEFDGLLSAEYMAVEQVMLQMEILESTLTETTALVAELEASGTTAIKEEMAQMCADRIASASAGQMEFDAADVSSLESLKEKAAAFGGKVKELLAKLVAAVTTFFVGLFNRAEGQKRRAEAVKAQIGSVAAGNFKVKYNNTYAAVLSLAANKFGVDFDASTAGKFSLVKSSNRVAGAIEAFAASKETSADAAINKALDGVFEAAPYQNQQKFGTIVSAVPVKGGMQPGAYVLVNKTAGKQSTTIKNNVSIFKAGSAEGVMSKEQFVQAADLAVSIFTELAKKGVMDQFKAEIAKVKAPEGASAEHTGNISRMARTLLGALKTEQAYMMMLGNAYLALAQQARAPKSDSKEPTKDDKPGEAPKEEPKKD